MGAKYLSFDQAMDWVSVAANGSGNYLAVGGIWSGTPAATSVRATRLTAPPAVLVAAPNLSYSAPSSFSIRFSEDVQSSLTASDLVVENLTAGTTIDPADVAMNYDPSTYIATITFPRFAGGILPSGSWRLTLAASGVTNSAGRAVRLRIWCIGCSGYGWPMAAVRCGCGRAARSAAVTMRFTT